jgi:hypothetical protein
LAWSRTATVASQETARSSPATLVKLRAEPAASTSRKEMNANMQSPTVRLVINRAMKASPRAVTTARDGSTPARRPSAAAAATSPSCQPISGMPSLSTMID